MIYSPDGGRRERENTRRLAVRDVDSCLEYSPGKKSMRHGDVLDKGERITVSGLVSKAGKPYAAAFTLKDDGRNTSLELSFDNVKPARSSRKKSK